MTVKEFSNGCSAARQHKVSVWSLMQCTYSLKSTVISKDVESSITCVTSTLAKVFYTVLNVAGEYTPSLFPVGFSTEMGTRWMLLEVVCLWIV